MEGFKNISYMLSHIFLFTFIYLFNVHKYSKRTTIGICFLSFFLITITDILKLSNSSSDNYRTIHRNYYFRL